MESGVIQFERTSGVVDNTFAYSYNNRLDNNNLRTIQSFSTNASVTMKGPDGNYYKEFQSFVNYYGDTDYGDKWVTAAYQKNNTSYTSQCVFGKVYIHLRNIILTYFLSLLSDAVIRILVSSPNVTAKELP